MDDFACPRCRTTKFQNPSLRMLVNVCGHGLCESCVDLLFLKGSGSCPECRTPLRRNNFRLQTFEDAAVEKEVDIRRRVLRDFNKKQEDFACLREYNDYLEEIETIVFNLCNNVDVINTNKRIEQYKKDNREQIQKNKSRLGKDEYEIEELLELERRLDRARRVEALAEESEAKKRRLQRKEALIDELTFSETDAKNIVETFAQQVKEEKQEEERERKPARQKVTARFSTGIEFGRKSRGPFLPVPLDDGPPYSYSPVVIEPDGPRPPSEEEVVPRRFIDHVRGETAAERAGGFNTKVACLRALQEAMMGLYHTKKSVH